MNVDPIGLRDMPTPESIRLERATPLREVTALHARLLENRCADSLETKIVILAHILFLAYTDLKDHTTK